MPRKQFRFLHLRCWLLSEPRHGSPLSHKADRLHAGRACWSSALCGAREGSTRGGGALQSLLQSFLRRCLSVLLDFMLQRSELLKWTHFFQMSARSCPGRVRRKEYCRIRKREIPVAMPSDILCQQG